MMFPSRMSRRGIVKAGIAGAASAVLGNTPARAGNITAAGWVFYSCGSLHFSRP